MTPSGCSIAHANVGTQSVQFESRKMSMKPWPRPLTWAVLILTVPVWIAWMRIWVSPVWMRPKMRAAPDKWNCRRFLSRYTRMHGQEPRLGTVQVISGGAARRQPLGCGALAQPHAADSRP